MESTRAACVGCSTLAPRAHASQQERCTSPDRYVTHMASKGRHDMASKPMGMERRKHMIGPRRTCATPRRDETAAVVDRDAKSGTGREKVNRVIAITTTSIVPAVSRDT